MKRFQNIIRSSLILIIFGMVLTILLVSVRGKPGVPNSKQINTSQWKENGPFELSPERGRFALLYSIVEDKSFQFSHDIGTFAEPDVAVSKGKFVSLFAPLVSVVTIPGYILGSYFGASQYGTFAVISIFAFLNVILIYLIAMKLQAQRWAALICALMFIFATPAFAYAVNLYQHHISTFLILLSIYSLLVSESFWSLGLVFFLCALAIPLDYPNVFFLFPIGLYALTRTMTFQKYSEKFVFRIDLKRTLALLVMAIPILGFLMFNYVSYGDPFQLSGTLQTVENLNRSKKANSIETLKTTPHDTVVVKKTALGSFKSRNILNGFYILFVSPDRGVLYYAPIILLGILGIIMAQRRKVKLYSVLVATVGANILLYSMWGDPWGGWAFGARYLIPSYALLSVFGALALTYIKYRLWPSFVIIPILFYSVAVNTLGAITTSAMPPQVEVLALEKISGTIQRYTYLRNWEFILSGHSKSFFYQTVLHNYITSLQFYEILTFTIFATFGLLFALYVSTEK